MRRFDRKFIVRKHDPEQEAALGERDSDGLREVVGAVLAEVRAADVEEVSATAKGEHMSRRLGFRSNY